MPALTQTGEASLPAHCIESVAGGHAQPRSAADPPPRLRYSVLNRFGRAFTLGLSIPLLQRQGSGFLKPAVLSRGEGQQLLRASLASAGVYETAEGHAFPVEGAAPTRQKTRCAYTVSLHFN